MQNSQVNDDCMGIHCFIFCPKDQFSSRKFEACIVDLAVLQIFFLHGFAALKPAIWWMYWKGDGPFTVFASKKIEAFCKNFQQDQLKTF